MIGQIITDILTGASAVTDLINYTVSGQTRTALYPVRVPQDVPMPAVTYMVRGVESEDTKDNFTGIDRFRIQINIFSDDYNELNKVDMAVRDAMIGGEGEYSVENYDNTNITVDVGVSRHEDTDEDYFEDLERYGRATEYMLITNRTP